MKKTYLKDTTILSIVDFQNSEKTLLGKFLFGFVIKDETNRFEPGFRVITSTIKTQDCSEIITKSGSCYVINIKPEELNITFAEFVVMRHRLYSPAEILKMRKMLKQNDDRIIH